MSDHRSCHLRFCKTIARNFAFHAIESVGVGADLPLGHLQARNVSKIFPYTIGNWRLLAFPSGRLPSVRVMKEKTNDVQHW
jgi:hypothetical protein